MVFCEAEAEGEERVQVRACELFECGLIAEVKRPLEVRLGSIPVAAA